MTLRAHLEQWIHKQWAKRGLLSWLLRPLSWLTALYIHHKQRQPRQPLALSRPPIIVVGNIIVGGAGKTPVVLALCQHLKQQGWNPGIISRGYGVKIEGAPLVGQGQIEATIYGDEPSLLAQQSGAPIAVHPQRVQALQALLQHYPKIDVVIADDGLQHQALSRDIEIIVQDQRGIGNGLLLPAGPLREPPQRLRNADWLITQSTKALTHVQTPTPLDPERSVQMQLTPQLFEHLESGRLVCAKDWLKSYQNHHCAAVAAIGQPSRFFHMLKNFGLKLQNQIALADHSQIPASTFSQLPTDLILITAKDAVKCKQNTDSRVWVVHVKPDFTPSHWLHHVAQQLQQLRQKQANHP